MPKAALDKLARRYGLGQYAGAPGATAPTTAGSPLVLPGQFKIEEQSDRYLLSPISYNNGVYQVGLSKKLLDNESTHTQEEWTNLLQNTEWRLPSGPLMLGIMTALYNERTGAHADAIKKIQKLLRKDFKDNWMTTGTRIKYNASGIDEVIHEYNTPDEYTVEADIVGPQDWVTPTSGFEDSIDTLVGMRDLALLEKVSQWGSVKKPYLWRYTNKVDDVWALVLGVYDDDGFIINASGVGINYDRPARGVAAREKFP